MDIWVNLKVIEVHAPAVARTMGEPVAMMLGGLNLLWHRTWSTKSDTISRIGLQGIFGPDRIEMRIEAMIDAGFLEAMPDGSFRIRGAARYLRIQEALSRGGHAAKSNLIPGGKKGGSRDTIRGVSRETSRAGADEESGDVSGSAEGGSRETSRAESPDPSREGAEKGPRLDLGLPPITDHRTPSKGSPRKAAKEASTPDPRHQPLIEQLDATYRRLRGRKYPFQPIDAKAVKSLLALAEPADIDAAWAKALDEKKYPVTSTFSELLRNLGHFIGAKPSTSKDWRSQTTDYAAAWGVES